MIVTLGQSPHPYARYGGHLHSNFWNILLDKIIKTNIGKTISSWEKRKIICSHDAASVEFIVFLEQYEKGGQNLILHLYF